MADAINIIVRASALMDRGTKNPPATGRPCTVYPTRACGLHLTGIHRISRRFQNLLLFLKWESITMIVSFTTLGLSLGQFDRREELMEERGGGTVVTQDRLPVPAVYTYIWERLDGS